MASTFVTAGEESMEPVDHQVPSPRTMRRSWSSNSSTCDHGSTAVAPKCVCAPATHARSFKCRLHRVNSHGHSAESAPTTPTLPQQPSVSSSSSTRTVEAQ